MLRNRFISFTGVLLVGAFALSSCSKTVEVPFGSMDINVKVGESSGTVASTEETASSVAESSETTAQEPFVYNPHPYSPTIAVEVAQDYWDSLYNMIDAIRGGKDTFECSSKEAYEWCVDSKNLSNYMPAACLKIAEKSPDGSKAFENGIGRIYYTIPAEELIARENDFEEKVMEAINATVEKDDTEFEKCFKLFNYMACNYTYRYEDDSVENFGKEGYIYTTFMQKTGQCIDLAGVYAFLLRQVGIDAFSVGCHSPIDHEWTYAIINGRGYHLDPTWALKSEYGTDDLYLKTFMMTTEQRRESGCGVDDIVMQLSPQYWISRSKIKLEADDDRYFMGVNAVYDSLDEENKVLYYLDADGVKQALKYGEME